MPQLSVHSAQHRGLYLCTGSIDGRFALRRSFANVCTSTQKRTQRPTCDLSPMDIIRSEGSKAEASKLLGSTAASRSGWRSPSGAPWSVCGGARRAWLWYEVAHIIGADTSEARGRYALLRYYPCMHPVEA